MLTPLEQALLAARGGVRQRAPMPARPVVNGFDPRPLPTLADPNSTRADVAPGDLAERQDADEQKPTTEGVTLTQEQAKELLNEAEAQFVASRGRKSLKAWLFLESRAVFGGDMWNVWDGKQAKWRDIRPAGWEGMGRRFETLNLVRGKVLENIARITRNDPDIGVTPETARPQDVQGAHEARAVLDHFDREWNSAAMIRSAVQESDVSGAPCWKVYFDPSAEDDVPAGVGPDGTPAQVESARVGKVRCELIPWEQWFAPTGNFYDSAGEIALPWAGHARPVRLTDLQAYYKNGSAVEPEPNVSGDLNVMAQVSGAYVQPLGSVTDRRDGWALLKERYETPTPALKKQGYAHGRVTVWANGVLLAVWDMRDGFPLFPIYHLKIENDVDGLNYVGNMLSIQRSVNRAFSKQLEMLDEPSYSVWVQAQTQVTPGAFKGTGVRRVDYNGPMPTIHPKPNLPVSDVQTFQTALSLFDRLSLITPGDQLSSSDASNVAIQTKLEADESAQKDQLGNLFASLLWRAGRVIKLVATYYDTPRLIRMSEDDDPNGAAASVASFRALNGGARVKLKLSDDSGTPRTPALQVDFYKSIMGMLTPDNAPLIIALLQSIDMAGTDDAAEKLGKVIERMQAQKAASEPKPAELEAQKHQQQAEQMALQAHVDQEHAAIALHSAEELKRLDAQIQMALKRLPSVGLAGKLDPQATVSAEKELGLQTDLATAKQMAVPPKPTMAGRPAGKTGVAAK